MTVEAERVVLATGLAYRRRPSRASTARFVNANPRVRLRSARC